MIFNLDCLAEINRISILIKWSQIINCIQYETVNSQCIMGMKTFEQSHVKFRSVEKHNI